MARENISPEELLFKAIEKGGRGFYRLPLPGFKKTNKERKNFDLIQNLKVINKILTVAGAILIALLILDITTTSRKINKDSVTNVNLGNWQFQKAAIAPLKEFSFYEEAAKKRDLFNPGENTQAQGLKPPAGNLKLQELAKDLSLVGIYYGKDPEVMIEDKQEKKTYFLRQGDQIKELKIKNILKDRITLEYHGEQMELM